MIHDIKWCKFLVSKSSPYFLVTSGFDLPEDLFDAYLGEGMGSDGLTLGLLVK